MENQKFPTWEMSSNMPKMNQIPTEKQNKFEQIKPKVQFMKKKKKTQLNNDIKMLKNLPNFVYLGRNTTRMIIFQER